jgi:hypothetical protein
MWPDYDTGVLNTPEGMGPGAIGLFEIKKSPNKKDASIKSIKILKKSEK